MGIMSDAADPHHSRYARSDLAHPGQPPVPAVAPARATEAPTGALFGSILSKRARKHNDEEEPVRVGIARDELCAVHITGVASYTSKSVVRAVFSSVAPPNDVLLLQVTPSAKTHLITYKTSASALLAVQRFHGMLLENSKIKVRLYDSANETPRLR
jgi:hypothetical protein